MDNCSGRRLRLLPALKLRQARRLMQRKSDVVRYKTYYEYWIINENS
jgi:hypothetical protein